MWADLLIKFRSSAGSDVKLTKLQINRQKSKFWGPAGVHNKTGYGRCWPWKILRSRRRRPILQNDDDSLCWKCLLTTLFILNHEANVHPSPCSRRILLNQNTKCRCFRHHLTLDLRSSTFISKTPFFPSPELLVFDHMVFETHWNNH